MPVFPAWFRGLVQEIDGCRQNAPFAFSIHVEIAIPAYPECVLTVPEASVQLYCNALGPRGRAVKVPASWHEEVTSFTVTPPIPHWLQYHHVYWVISLPIVFSGLKSIFPGLFYVNSPGKYP